MLRVIPFRGRSPSDDDPSPGGGQARPKGGRLIVLAEVDARSKQRRAASLEQPLRQAA